MAYNPYLQNYPNYFASFPQVSAQQNSNPIVWVQGLEGAKAYPVGSNNSVLLMDSEENIFYIKSSDSSGMPMPLRVFDYTERTEEVGNERNFVTKEEFDKAISKISEELKTKFAKNTLVKEEENEQSFI